MNENPIFNILIVDDEKSNLEVLNHILKPEYTIYIAKSGEMALKKAAEDKPDLILLDIVMPDMSGYDVLVALKEMDATRSIPVIFITGLANVADEEKGFLLGAVDYITKPFNNSIVKARVRTHLKTVQQIRTIEKLGMVDALTEIPNRRSFDHQINKEWSRAIREHEPISILMVDVDMFKAYNDTYGHLEGDILLQALAKVFKQGLRRSGDFVARIGGEEFSVILPNTNLVGAIEIAANLCQLVSEMEVRTMENVVTSITISVGIASANPSIEDILTDLLAKADAELYRAKAEGRNRFCY